MKFYNIKSTYLLLLLALLVFFGACKTRKVLPKADVNAAEKDSAARLTAIQQAQVNFNTLAIKSKALLNMDGSTNEVTINFRMVKDQQIWISVTAIAGLEVARALISPDSIKILNRLESTYIKKPFSFIADFSNEQINFGTLQAILVGNVWNEVFTQKPLINVSENSLQLSGQSGTLNYQIQFNELFKVSNAVLQDTLANQQLSVNYADFFLDAGLILPHQFKIQTATGKKAIRAELKYTKVDKDIALDFPFNVPKRFSVKN